MFVGLLAVWAMVLVVPGPDVLQTFRVALYSFRSGLACATGIAAGTAVWITASLAGMSALVQRHPGALGFLQLAGGAYLLYLGISAVTGFLKARRAQRATAADAPPADAATPQLTPSPESAAPAAERFTLRRAFGLGLATNLSNPKALLFFGAAFAQFLRPDSPVVLIGAAMLAMSWSWFSLLAALVHTAARWVGRYSAVIDAAAGVLFAALGVSLLVEGSFAVAALAGAGG